MRHDAGSRGGTKASAMVFALAFLLAHAAALRLVPDAAAACFAFLIAVPHAADAATSLQAAVAALDAAKRAGRNRVGVAGAEDGSEAAWPRAGG